jgi:two-component system cell cycle sensor histidine kinase/response regulator CckA
MAPLEQTPVLKSPQQTILVVDDEPANLELISRILDHYNVLTANNGKDAFQKSQNFKDEIHLLLTDFEMPGTSGIDLATEITRQRPKIKVLLMSGYTAGMLVLNEGWHFLPKPFIASQLRTLIGGLIAPDLKSKFAA